MNNHFNMGFPSDAISRICHFKHDTFLIKNPWYSFPFTQFKNKSKNSSSTQVQKSASVVSCFSIRSCSTHSPLLKTRMFSKSFSKTWNRHNKSTSHEKRKNESSTARTLIKKQTKLTVLPFFPQNGPWIDVQKLFVFEKPFQKLY